MAGEPRDLLQKMILELRKRLDRIEEKLESLDRIEKKVDDLAYMTHNALGFAASNHVRLAKHDDDIAGMQARIKKLEAKR